AGEVLARQQTTTTAHRLVLDAPARLEGVWDAGRLAQVLGNLVSNAIKYTPGGEVRVRLVASADAALCQVSDRGPGIDPARAGLLFAPYVRLDEAGAGTGLGLFIARGIVVAHGGRLWVESARGRGSTFCLTLPLVPPETRQLSSP